MNYGELLYRFSALPPICTIPHHIPRSFPEPTIEEKPKSPRRFFINKCYQEPGSCGDRHADKTGGPPTSRIGDSRATASGSIFPHMHKSLSGQLNKVVFVYPDHPLIILYEAKMPYFPKSRTNRKIVETPTDTVPISAPSSLLPIEYS